MTQAPHRVREFKTLQAFVACVGQEVGVSDFLDVTQERIDRFADATGDHQWIHVDAVRAVSGPYGGTIAHGLLTLSLIPYFSQRAFQVRNARLGINYGFDRVRFPAPTPVEARLRARFVLKSAEALPPLNGLSGYQTVLIASIEREGHERPVCVAENVARRYG